ncbi:MAG TPA: sulfur carrier protein ThiS [Bryobacteraceae bacterium]|jgi:sulfur carrier protein|nr:sulfur carrier protein ThiS [Bryobacteraceae bacterium]
METAETKTIEVVVNGAARTIPAGLSIGHLLEWLKIDVSRVAVELNGQIVRQPEWPVAAVHEGARIEVVWFVGGG